MVWFLLAIPGAICLYGVYIYNQFISLKNRVANAWAQVNVQIKKRSDLIPQLVNVVKGYSKYEKSTLSDIAKMRTEIMSAESVGKKYELNKKIGSSLKQIFAVAESYPTLKANENFLKLQEEVSDVEDKIAFTRQFYNDTVYKFNTLLHAFPSSLIAKLMKLKPAVSFEESSEYKGVEF